MLTVCKLLPLGTVAREPAVRVELTLPALRVRCAANYATPAVSSPGIEPGLRPSQGRVRSGTLRRFEIRLPFNARIFSMDDRISLRNSRALNASAL
jgi:hypothetical protein